MAAYTSSPEHGPVTQEFKRQREAEPDHESARESQRESQGEPQREFQGELEPQREPQSQRESQRESQPQRELEPAREPQRELEGMPGPVPESDEVPDDLYRSVITPTDADTATSDATVDASTKKGTSITRRLPKQYFRVLQALVWGSQVQASLVYASRSHGRFTLKLTGPWKAILDRCCFEGSIASDAARMYPPTPNLEGVERWGAVLLKMQLEVDMDGAEETCHWAVNTTCPEISPRFLIGLTIKGIRVSFIEWLDNCESMYTLYREESALLTRSLRRRLEAAVQDMWLSARVLHCDMHMNNVLVDQKARRAYIIDYGMAVHMPEDVRMSLDVFLAAHASGAQGHRLRAAYAECCQAYAHKSLVKRGYEIGEKDDWNSDGSFLELLRQYCRA